MPPCTGWQIPLFASLCLHGVLALGLCRWPMHAAVSSGLESSGFTMQFVEEPEAPAKEAGEGDGPKIHLKSMPGLIASQSAAKDDVPMPAGGQPVDTSGQTSVVGQIANPSYVPSYDPSYVGGGQGASNQGAGQGGQGAGGLGGKGTFFHIPTHGKRIVYLIDTSASMGLHGAWAAARRELLASVQSLPASCQFQILVYNSMPQALLPRQPDWMTPTPSVLREVADALATLPIEGRTDHLAALRRALTMQADVLFFLTDADDLTTEHLRQAQLLNRDRAVIHTVELSLAHRHRPGMPLQVLARNNQGTYQAVDLSRYK